MIQKLEVISSKSNAKFKYYLDLQSTKEIKKNKEFMVFGEKAIQDTIKNYPKYVNALLLPKDYSIQSVIGKLNHSVAAHYFEKELFNELDLFGTKYPILVCALPEIQTWETALQEFNTEKSFLLCPLGDPSNVGALCRNALAFGTKNIILLKESAFAFHPKAVRATSAHLLGLNFYFGPSIKDLNSFSIDNLIALDKSKTNIQNYEWPKNYKLLVGEEGPGIPNELKCDRVQIPMQVAAESLNASVASGIALFLIANKI